MNTAHLIEKPKSKPEAQAEIDSSSAHKVEEKSVNQIGVPRFLQQALGSSVASPRDGKTENNHTTNKSTLPAVQTKLTVSESDDEYERQADEVADKVASANAELPEVSQLPDVSQHLQTKAEHGQQQSTIASTTPKQIQSNKLGEPLSGSVRAKVEPVLGADLSPVRVHNDADSHQASQNLQAKAFTHQNHIYLGKNQSTDDMKLMAHEATHVVQQTHPDTLIQREKINPGSLCPRDVLQLQRTIGNQAGQRASSSLCPSIQRTPASPNDIQREDAPAASQQNKYVLDEFEHDDFNLTEDHKAKLDEDIEAIQKVLAANPEANIKIVGHTDTTGTPDTNTAIGQSRANTVKNALVERGIAEDRITTVASMGEGQPRVKTDDGVREAKNRRVEIEIVGVKVPAPAKKDKLDEQPEDAANKEPVKKNDAEADEETDTKTDEEKDAKEGKSKFRASATIATLPYKIEFTPGKDPKKKFIVTGDFTVDYLLWKYRTGNFKLEIPASLQLAMLGIHDYKDKKWKFGSDLELGVGVNLKYSPFKSSALENLYFKGGLDFSITGGLTTDFSKVTPGGNIGSDLKLGVGYTLGPVDLLLFGKGSFALDPANGKGKFSVAPMFGVTIPLGKKEDKK